ncbi:hypothetical protein HWV62_12735 [Athelia sp. TMB]|nr:hypothetical protein HWV62_12735 [Athelia sp. TMB]
MSLVRNAIPNESSRARPPEVWQKNARSSGSIPSALSPMASPTRKRKRTRVGRDHESSTVPSLGPGSAVLSTQEVEAGGEGLIGMGVGMGEGAQVQGKGWGSTVTIVDADVGFVDDVQLPEDGDEDGDDGSMSVDRSDARLLSPAPRSPIPLCPEATDASPPEPDEEDDAARARRRLAIASSRDVRLAALRARDGDADEGREMWGGSDEEADPTQTALMARTARAVAAAANGAQLEMRILANHGGDKRFAFLRGRWARAWAAARMHAREEKAREEREAKGRVGLGGLADYGDSDGEEEEGGEGGGGGGIADADVDEDVSRGASIPGPSATPEVAPEPEEEDDDDVDAAVKAARKWRAKEWAEMRRKRVSVGLGT